MLFSLIASCEKEVHISLKSEDPKVVIQGSIETGQPPYVVLTNTIGFFGKVDLSTMEDAFIHNADVKVSDGINMVTLKEYSIDTGNNYKFYIYFLDTTAIGSFAGVNGKNYSLTVTCNGKTYSASTRIPFPQGVDTMWFDRPEFEGPKTPDSALQMFVTYTDPDTPGDYVRYFTSRGTQPFYASGNFSDEVVNGKTIANIGLAGGYVDDGVRKDRDSLVYFFPGEHVTLKWCAIDKGVYDFWNTLDFAKGAVGNPFSSPINPLTNIRNGGLGVWAGYGVFYVSAIVPHVP